MGWFDIFRRKEKAVISSGCNKETMEGECLRTEGRSFGKDSSCFSQGKTLEALQMEEKEAAYQAYMDYAKGSDTPEEAYMRRGFIKDQEGKWVYKKRMEYTQGTDTEGKEEQTTVFRMITKEKQPLELTYTGHTRYSPNRSSACGYGSDDWMYLCREKDIYYLLTFSDDAGYGTGWSCTQLLAGDYERLVERDVLYWQDIALSKERTKFYAIRLQDARGVRHLLPVSSRCCDKLTDAHFLR